MIALVINSGSSSLKFSVVDTANGKTLANGLFDKLGSDAPTGKLKAPGLLDTLEKTLPAGASHAESLTVLAAFLAEAKKSGLEIQAVGHRVVHGGERFGGSLILDEETLQGVEACNGLAPLHNPPNLLGIRKALEIFPGLPQVGVFDTAFHSTLPKENYLYPLPLQLYREHKIRRYGFHGSSHKYVSIETARRLGIDLDKVRLITAHLGNGCSATAVQNGKSVDTTMGFTPLEGLTMGTRSGDIDPGILFYLYRNANMSIDEIDNLLNKKSGLPGMSEISNDMRTLREKANAGEEKALTALKVFILRLAKSLASLRVSLDGLDALVFTGGIGENDPQTRAETLAYLGHLGFELDEAANAKHGADNHGIITKPGSKSLAIVVQTNEELMIAQEAQICLDNA